MPHFGTPKNIMIKRKLPCAAINNSAVCSCVLGSLTLAQPQFASLAAGEAKDEEDFRIDTNIAPRKVKVCEVCGAEGVKGRYCRSCAVDTSKGTMAQVALLGAAR